MSGPAPFSFLSDDIVLNILSKLRSDPRHWARLCCVSSRFSSLIRSFLYPSSSFLCSDLIDHHHHPVDWSTLLHNLSVCCPGLLRSGVLLESSDFGLERDIGPSCHLMTSSSSPSTSSAAALPPPPPPRPNPPPPPPVSCWSLFDDLYFDTVYDPSESQAPAPSNQDLLDDQEPPVSPGNRKRKLLGPAGSHLAAGSWNLSREQGNKLLASRFRGDSLYICEWPGCVHVEEKRKYMLFRGMFKNFKRSRVWRTINDGSRVKIGLDCAFCGCNEMWDLHSAFCLRRVFGFHDDGEPVVRAYVCENGHVSGAWTERPMYN